MAMQIVGRERRKLRIRKKISGHAPSARASPSSAARKHIYAQVIDDVDGHDARARLDPLARTCKGALDEANKTDAAKKVGAPSRRSASPRGSSKVVFDRNGYLYHGRVSALAEAAREAGLKF